LFYFTVEINYDLERHKAITFPDFEKKLHVEEVLVNTPMTICVCSVHVFTAISKM